MRDSPPRPWLPFVLLLIGLLLLVLFEAGLLGPFEAVFHYALDPLQRLFAGGAEFSTSLFGGGRDARELRARVDELQAQVNALTVENIRLREYEAEVLQLRAMLNFVSEYPVSAPLGAEVVSREACDTFPCAEILGVDANPYLRYITINVGAQQGVRVGMPVVSSGAALVGRVSRVGPRTAKVQLINDTDSAVAALVQRSRVTGLVRGQADGTLRMEYVPQGDEDEVQVGDIVLTSGLGGVLPKGLVIGQVAEVTEAPYELFEPVLVRPAVDFARLELVLVITAFEALPVEETGP